MTSEKETNKKQKTTNKQTKRMPHLVLGGTKQLCKMNSPTDTCVRVRHGCWSEHLNVRNCDLYVRNCDLYVRSCDLYASWTNAAHRQPPTTTPATSTLLGRQTARTDAEVSIALPVPKQRRSEQLRCWSQVVRFGGPLTAALAVGTKPKHGTSIAPRVQYRQSETETGPERSCRINTQGS